MPILLLLCLYFGFSDFLTQKEREKTSVPWLKSGFRLLSMYPKYTTTLEKPNSLIVPFRLPNLKRRKKPKRKNLRRKPKRKNPRRKPKKK